MSYEREKEKGKRPDTTVPKRNKQLQNPTMLHIEHTPYDATLGSVVV